MDVELEVPGSYTLADHAIFRADLGAAGSLVVEEPPRPDVHAPPPPDGGHGH